MRREGYIKFSPLAVIANQHVFDAALTCIKTVELVRPNGDKLIIGFARTLVKKFNPIAGTWDTIGSGYSANGKRWKTVTINGTLIANNGIDLPFYFNVPDAAVTPMYELREVGVASVGRICENNGFLIIADITEIKADLLQAFMRGWSSYAFVDATSRSASFTIGPSNIGTLYNVTTGATNRVATLPVATADFYCYIKKVDNGSGAVTTIPILSDIVVTLTAINDLALIWFDNVLGRYFSMFFAGGVIPVDAPYGIPPSNIVQRVPWDVANGEYGIPTQWAPVFEVYMPAASATINLPFPSSVFIANQTRVAVVNGGPLGGTLGGQENYPNGILVTAVSGRTLTLEVTTDITLSYPRIVEVLRWTDVSSLVGRYHLQGDNSEITSLVTLREWLVITRTTGIYQGRYTGDPAAPFVFTPVYSGSNVPLWPDAIANVNGDYLLYPARGNRMYKYDGTTWPSLHDVTDACSNAFFGSYDQTTEVYAMENPITKEIFFCYPDLTLAYDFFTAGGGTVSAITQNFDAASFVHKPGSTDFWFIMAIGNKIYLYGLVYGLVPLQTFLRDGVAVNSLLLYGLWHGQSMLYGAWTSGDQMNERLLKSITPLFSNQSPDTIVQVYLGGTHNPNAGVTQLMTPSETLPTPSGMNYVTCAYQRIYFEIGITITDPADKDCRLVGLLLEADVVNAAGVTRSVN